MTKVEGKGRTWFEYADGICQNMQYRSTLKERSSSNSRARDPNCDRNITLRGPRRNLSVPWVHISRVRLVVSISLYIDMPKLTRDKPGDGLASVLIMTASLLVW